MAEADPRQALSGQGVEPPFLDRRNAMLAAAEAPDWANPAPPRDGCRVIPLIEAADMYPMLEQLVLGAERSVWMSFRVFDPATLTRSEEARALGLDDWAAPPRGG